MSKSESSVQKDIRLALSYQRCQVWRNNSGAYQDEHGNYIRYGLANDSKELNARIKSSDLIGITPLLITPAHVGRFVGVFTAVEVKAPNWRSDKRSQAQAAFHDIVRDVGGFAGFATSREDALRIIGRIP